ncbi:MAG: histidinol dehydrogenase, partial [Verrucomicrobia bacterium]|nr:histidinol dehydrogenase [Verrucomicrobiota bacterium]
MQILRYHQPDYAQAVARLKRSAMPVAGVEQTVREILEAVVTRGDAAVLEYTERFGGPRLEAAGMLEGRIPRVSERTKRVVEAAWLNVHRFAR